MEMEGSVVLVSLCCFFAHICSRPSLLLITIWVPRQTEPARGPQGGRRRALCVWADLHPFKPQKRNPCFVHPSRVKIHPLKALHHIDLRISVIPITFLWIAASFGRVPTSGYPSTGIPRQILQILHPFPSINDSRRRLPYDESDRHRPPHR